MLLLMCLQALGEGFFCFSWERKLLLVKLYIKFISKFNHGFTNHGYFHCAIKALYGFKEKRARKARDMQLFLQNVKIEIFKILKMFKNNMKFSRAAC